MDAARQLAIADLILRFGRVNRATLHPDGERWETDTDHTVMLAVLALEIVADLERYATALLGLERLVHDGPDAQGTPSAEVAP